MELFASSVLKKKICHNWGMKNLIILASLCLISLRLYAHDVSDPSKHSKNSDAKELTAVLKALDLPADDKGRCPFGKWEMEKMDADKIQPEWQCFFAKRDLQRDSKECFISPTFLKDPANLSKSQMVKGFISYVGMAPFPYQYLLEPMANGGVVAVVKIHYPNLKDFSELEQLGLKSRWQEAQEIWNAYSINRDLWSVRVEIVDSSSEGYFHPHLTNKDTRGPYFASHSINPKYWTKRTMAHELGHMLGLDDEYDQIQGTISKRWGCNPKSLMCGDPGTLFEYHFYTIFRRAFCADDKIK